MLEDCEDALQRTRMGRHAHSGWIGDFGVEPRLSLPGRMEPRRDRTRSGRRLNDGVAREAVRTMQIATQHPEAERHASRQDMEERLLFDRVTGQPGDIAVRYAQRAAVVDPDLADPRLPRRN